MTKHGFENNRMKSRMPGPLAVSAAIVVLGSEWKKVIYICIYLWM